MTRSAYKLATTPTTASRTAEDERLVDHVMQRRVREFEPVVRDLGGRDAEAAVAALQSFSAAVGRLPEGRPASL